MISNKATRKLLIFIFILAYRNMDAQDIIVASAPTEIYHRQLLERLVAVELKFLDFIFIQ